MRFISSAVCGAMLAATATALSVADASAWSRFHDHIYADSFGNLVIQSPNGYKRIVVGQGHLAGKLKSYEGVRDPDVVYLDEDDESYEGGALYRDCYRPPYRWKGRSYMYGLPDHVVPQAPCADE
jgi:hypothetical protein